MKLHVSCAAPSSLAHHASALKCLLLGTGTMLVLLQGKCVRELGASILLQNLVERPACVPVQGPLLQPQPQPQEQESSQPQPQSKQVPTICCAHAGPTSGIADWHDL